MAMETKEYQLINTVIYNVTGAKWDKDNAHTTYEDAEYDMHEGLDEDSVEIYGNTIRIRFVSTVEAQSQVKAMQIAHANAKDYWGSQSEWTVLDVFAEEIRYVNIELDAISQEQLELC